MTEDNPKVVADLVPKLLPLSTVQRFLQNLLRERVSIRDSATILEALGEAAAMTNDHILLTEYVRQAIRRLLVKPYLNQTGRLPAFFVDTQIEVAMARSIEYNEHASHLNLTPQKIRDIVESVTRAVGSAGTTMAVATSVRFLRQVIEGTLRNLSILSHNEIPGGVMPANAETADRLAQDVAGLRREIERMAPAAKARLAELVRGENASPSTPRRVGAAA